MSFSMLVKPVPELMIMWIFCMSLTVPFWCLILL